MRKDLASPRVCVIHPGALGDVLMAFCCLEALKQGQNAAIDIWCRSDAGLLAKSLGLANGVFSLESCEVSSLYAGAPSPQAVRRFSSYDLAVLFSFSTDLLQCLAGLIERTALLLPRPEKEKRLHVARHLYGLMQGHGLAGMEFTQALGQVLGRFQKAWPLKHAQSRAIILSPGAGSPRKRWPLENFIALYKDFESRGMDARFVLGPAEPDLGPVLQKAGVAESHVLMDLGMETLLETLSQARGFIGNDSGVSHLAGLLGIPGVAVFGPSDPLRWHPLGPCLKVARPELCREPCFETKDKNCQSPPPCLEKTSWQEVRDMLGQAMAGGDVMTGL